MRSYKIYKLESPNGKIYIGATCRKVEYRWNHGRGYSANKELASDIEKYGWENFQKGIIEDNLTKEQAEKKEIYWIDFYKSTSEKGYNKASGGFHPVLCEQTKAKMSESQKGKERDENYRRHISESKMGKKNGMYGVKGKEHPTARQVIAISPDGVATEYESMSFASEKLGLPTGAFKNICACCRGKKRTAYGYVWRYKDDKKDKRVS